MAIVYRSVATGAGSLSETTLWENDKPTSSFSSQTISLSQTMNNFTYIQIEWKLATNQNSVYREIIPVADFKTIQDVNFSAIVAFGTRGSTSSKKNYRRYYYASDTSIMITDVFVPGSTGDNNMVIPLTIKGLK